MVDRYGDLFGYATLRLARGDLTPGRPVALEVRGEDAGSRAWYMTFQHRFSSRPRIRQNPVMLRGAEGAEAEPVFPLVRDPGDSAIRGMRERLKPESVRTGYVLRRGYRSI